MAKNNHLHFLITIWILNEYYDKHHINYHKTRTNLIHITLQNTKGNVSKEKKSKDYFQFISCGRSRFIHLNVCNVGVRCKEVMNIEGNINRVGRLYMFHKKASCAVLLL